jgi:hypothetical protein
MAKDDKEPTVDEIMSWVGRWLRKENGLATTNPAEFSPNAKAFYDKIKKALEQYES